jgi:hypothetical protein
MAMATLRAQPFGSSACSAKIVGTISNFRSLGGTCIYECPVVFIYSQKLWLTTPIHSAGLPG